METLSFLLMNTTHWCGAATQKIHTENRKVAMSITNFSCCNHWSYTVRICSRQPVCVRPGWLLQALPSSVSCSLKGWILPGRAIGLSMNKNSCTGYSELQVFKGRVCGLENMPEHVVQVRAAGKHWVDKLSWELSEVLCAPYS